MIYLQYSNLVQGKVNSLHKYSGVPQLQLVQNGHGRKKKRIKNKQIKTEILRNLPTRCRLPLVVPFIPGAG